MREVYLVGAGQSDFGSFPTESYRSLFKTAFETALGSTDGELDRRRIDEAYIGTLGVGGRQLGLVGPSVTEHVGLDGTSCTRIENACAASGVALRQAILAIRAGAADTALAGGVEVMNDMSSDRTRFWLGVSGETEWERIEPEVTGTIVAHTVIEGGAPPEFETLLEAEDAIGAVLVELDEGVRVPGMLTDCDPHEFARGDRVEAVVRKMFEQEGIVRYGAKFRPV